MITDEELKAIEERVNAATPGPWKMWDGYEGPPGFSSADRIGPFGGGGISASMSIYGNNADFEFIAHAREDVPRLVEEVRRLRTSLSFIGNISSRPYAVSREYYRTGRIIEWEHDAIKSINKIVAQTMSDTAAPQGGE